MITSKLQQARVKLQQRSLKKSGKNQYYDYFELSDFIPSVNEIFTELQMHSMFNITKEKAILRIIDTEDSSEELYECPFIGAELRQCTKVQALGATITYLKRYLYMNALEIVESDFLDAKTNEDMAKEQQDLDILSGLEAVDTPENALSYYRKYKDKVANLNRFEMAYKSRYKILNAKAKAKQQQEADND